MPVRYARALALTTALGAAALLGANAIAQTPPTSPAPSQSAPAQPSPDTGPRGPGMGPGGMGPGGVGPGGVGPGGMGRGDGERGWGRGERRGDGYGYGMRGQGRGAQLSDQDRQALFSAHLAAAKAALALTPDQEKLWGPVENAVREAMKARQEWRARVQKEGVAANPIDRMRRMGEMASARGAAMTRLADAAGPLYASLTDDQKRRLRLVHGMGRGMMRGMMGDMMGPGMMGMMGSEGPRMGAGEWRGRDHDRHHDRHYDRHHRRGDGEGRRDRGDSRL